jgi:hypothetical protein
VPHLFEGKVAFKANLRLKPKLVFPGRFNMHNKADVIVFPVRKFFRIS